MTPPPDPFRLPRSPLVANPGTGTDALALPPDPAAVPEPVAAAPPPAPVAPPALVEFILAAPPEPRLLWG